MTSEIVFIVAALPGSILALWWIVSPQSYMRLLLSLWRKYRVSIWPSREQAESRAWRVFLRVMGLGYLAWGSYLYYASYHNSFRR